jgi:hypothetical protein
MNHVVANQLLASELQAYRELPFPDLRQLVGERSTRHIRGKDGVDYDLTMIVRWRLSDDGDIRVIGFIGESNWGSPHDTLDDTIVVPNPSPRSADQA